MDTKLIHTSKHVRFYEGMDYIEITTTNYRQLRIDLCRPLPEDQEEVPIAMLPTLDSQHIKLPKIHDKSVRLICDHDNLGIIIRCFPDRDRVYLKEIIPRIYFSKIKGWGNKFRGRYIFQIQNNPVVTLGDSG